MEVLERELFAFHGWEWLQYAKSGHVLAQDETAQPDEHGYAKPAWAEVQFDYRVPAGATRRITARVELTNRIEAIHSSVNDETYTYPQYAVAWLREDAE